MAVQFVLGRSGTGKTSYCIKAIVEALLEAADERPLLLLVPEQATYQAERAILGNEKIAGYHRLHVLSFDRLGFLLMGKNTALPRLSRIGRQMIVHRILRQNKEKLKVFGSLAGQVGLAQQMANTIAELNQYARTSDDMDGLLSELEQAEQNRLTAMKFADIGLIFKEYLRFIEARFIDPDAQLSGACGNVADAAFVKGAKLWVDGFASFTTSELLMLTEMLKAVQDAHIALCMDAGDIDLKRPDVRNLDDTGLFYPTQRTFTELMEIIKKAKLKLAEPVILHEPVRFSRCKALAHIEQNIFEPKAGKLAPAESIRVISAPNARVEVQFVARQIVRLVRQRDYRYRDIAVIASDIGRYEHYIRAYFENYTVPFFIDKRRPLNQHPAIELICSALQAVTNSFASTDIFAYLKSDLVPVERYDVDLLENYCVAFGIKADDWTSKKDWRFSGGRAEWDEKRIDKIRRRVSRPLLELRQKLYEDDKRTKMMTPEQFTRAVFDLLEGLNVRSRIGKWVEDAIDKSNHVVVDEHRQFYDKLVVVFDELVEVFADRKMRCEDYFAIINSAFSQLTLAFIPPSLDQVLVGSIERSRHPDLKAVFLIGATQGRFPVPLAPSGILTDADRQAAERADFELAAAKRRQLADHQYLAYIAFTRPAEFLCATYPAVDEDGSSVPRSQFIENIEDLFEDLREESTAAAPFELENISSKTDLTDLLCSQLGKDAALDSADVSREKLRNLLDDMTSDEQLSQLGSDIEAAIHYDNRAQLDSRLTKELLGERMSSSATRLSTFAACPYQYFARYILQLKEREEFKFEPLDLGNFYHRVLDALFKGLRKEKIDPATIDDTQLLKLLREQILKVTEAVPFIANFVRHSRHNLFIINSASEVLEDCVRAIAQMLRVGSFRPAMSEVAFGEAKDAVEKLGQYEIELADGRLLSLNGKIDRIDTAQVQGGQVAIVFDYKRKAKSFGWSQLYHGLDMQLPIYILAVSHAGGSNVKDAVGAFYMPVEVGAAGATIEQSTKKAANLDYKAKGIFNGRFFEQLDGEVNSGWSRFYSFRITAKDGEYGNYKVSAALRPDDFARLLDFTWKKIVELAKEILSGRIDIEPYRMSHKSPCAYCSYKPLCRFDWQINDYNFLESIDKVELLEKIQAVGQSQKST